MYPQSSIKWGQFFIGQKCIYEINVNFWLFCLILYTATLYLYFCLSMAFQVTSKGFLFLYIPVDIFRYCTLKIALLSLWCLFFNYCILYIRKANVVYFVSVLVLITSIHEFNFIEICQKPQQILHSLVAFYVMIINYMYPTY